MKANNASKRKSLTSKKTLIRKKLIKLEEIKANQTKTPKKKLNCWIKIKMKLFRTKKKPKKNGKISIAVGRKSAFKSKQSKQGLKQS